MHTARPRSLARSSADSAGPGVAVGCTERHLASAASIFPVPAFSLSTTATPSPVRYMGTPASSIHVRYRFTWSLTGVVADFPFPPADATASAAPAPPPQPASASTAVTASSGAASAARRYAAASPAVAP